MNDFEEKSKLFQSLHVQSEFLFTWIWIFRNQRSIFEASFQTSYQIWFSDFWPDFWLQYQCFSMFLGKMFILKFSNTTPIAFMKPYFYYTLMFLSEKTVFVKGWLVRILYEFSHHVVLCVKSVLPSRWLLRLVCPDLSAFLIVHKIYIF